MKKALRETQTLCAGCSKAEPKKFATPQTPFPGARDGQNLISWWRSLPLPTSPVWRGSMHAISSYRGNRHPHTHSPTHTHTSIHPHTETHTGPITIHCAAASCQAVTPPLNRSVYSTGDIALATMQIGCRCLSLSSYCRQIPYCFCLIYLGFFLLTVTWNCAILSKFRLTQQSKIACINAWSVIDSLKPLY